MSTLRTLLDAVSPPTLDGAGAENAWRPLRFDASSAEDREALAAQLRAGAIRTVNDTLAEQLDDLLRKRTPGRPLDADALAEGRRAFTGGAPLDEWGCWVLYPWSGELVHLLPAAEFHELRTARNRHKVTVDEQRVLAGKRLGVVGTSVGHAIALTLALEGVCGELRLADLDTLALSNLNRLRAATHELGLPKTVLAARHIAELDPYLKVTLFGEGFTEDNADRFLDGGAPLDLVFEECDDLFTKVLLREESRRRRIPVVMLTDDRGLIDIERFDREPERPLFHGRAGDVDPDKLRGLSTPEKVPLILEILGAMDLSHRAAASLVELGSTLDAFPQLGSEATLGGAIGAHAARTILLDQHHESGRWYVDLDAIMGGDDRWRDETLTHDAPTAAPGMETAQSQVGALQPGELERPEVERLVASAIRAPSSHNGQAWRFVYRGESNTLECRHDRARAQGMLDFRHYADHLAFGAAAENLLLESEAMGLDAQLRLLPDLADPELVCAFSFARGTRPATPPALQPEIARRATNRRRGPRQELTTGEAVALSAAVEERGARLQLVDSPDALSDLGQILGGGDRVVYLSKGFHEEIMAGVRWTPEQARELADGIDVATLEMAPEERAGLRLLSRWNAMRVLASVGGGRLIEMFTNELVNGSSALALITTKVTGDPRDAYFRGGRALQRAWLTASRLGLAVTPLAMMPYLFARLERGDGEGLSREAQRTLVDLRQGYRAHFDIPAGWVEPILFRVAKVPPPSTRAYRRPVERVLTFE